MEILTLFYFGITLFGVWWVAYFLYKHQKSESKYRELQRNDAIYGIKYPKTIEMINDSEKRQKERLEYIAMLDKRINSKKLIQTKSINKNIKDPITGEALDIVVCYCGTTYHKDTFNLYGCDCETKLLNEK